MKTVTQLETKLEELLEKTGVEIERLNGELGKPEVYSDYIKVEELQKLLESVQAENDAYTEEWLMLSEELEND